MKKENVLKILYAISAILIFAFLVASGIDVYKYNTGGYTIWLQYITQHGNNDSIIVGETTTSLIIANTAYRMSSGSPENPGEKG